MYVRRSLVIGQSDGTAHTSAAAVSIIPAAAKIPILGNYFDRIGKKLVIEAAGKLSTVITTPGTLQFTVKLGSTTVFDGLPILPDTVAAHTNVGWRLIIELVCRAIGASGNFMGRGMFISEDILGVAASMPKADAVALLPWNSTPAVGSNVDLTVSNVFDLLMTQVVATHSLTLQDLEVWCPNDDV